MKFVLKIVATICLGALFHATPTVAYSTGLTALYGLVCADYAQMSNDPTGATTSSLLYVLFLMNTWLIQYIDWGNPKFFLYAPLSLCPLSLRPTFSMSRPSLPRAAP